MVLLTTRILAFKRLSVLECKELVFLESISLAPCENGRCTEVGPNGFQVDWGRVLKCHPSEKIKFTWQISPNREPQPNPQKASVVEVNFTMINLKTTIVSLVHSGFEKNGEGD